MGEWWEDEWEEPWEDQPILAADLTVEVNPPEIVGTLLGPDGEPIRYLLDRPAVPFGFTA